MHAREACVESKHHVEDHSMSQLLIVHWLGTKKIEEEPEAPTAPSMGVPPRNVTSFQ
jgi:hypothetical protein